MVLNYGFTDGIYNGSYFSLLSIYPILQPDKEMGIVGGTGLFRLARGYAIVHTYQLNATTGDAIDGYNVVVDPESESSGAIAKATQAQDSEWAERVETGSEVITTLQFYFHDTLSGPNPSAIRIAKTLQPYNSSTQFGELVMIDDPLTVGLDPSSKIVGRGRGMYGSTGQTDSLLILVFNYQFSDGIYNGSSFNVHSICPMLRPDKELSIVGGTGLFRLARGYAIVHTFSLDPITGDTIDGYNVTIITNV
ncbi:hypothetical protein BUALT_Bualt15G0013300 [Buddleja alternifolia]|uniref:Dirigent protein n=1 Tax=Buddleja alternifolia TaxID=168488 RepID=A0AAV6WKV2_9LAMI|nr:hypothetical protein BUALT_Bualt15G0013300 [Buddleja alternifolia]